MPRRKMGRNANGEGTKPRLLADGRYRADITVHDPSTGEPRRAYVYGKTEAECTKKKIQRLSEDNAGIYTKPCNLTMAQWLEVWLSEYCVDVKPRTLDKYRSVVRVHLIPQFGKVKLSALSVHHIQRFYNGTLKGAAGFRKLSPKSIRDVNGVLHRALQQAVDVDYLKVNPADKCKIPRVEKTELNTMGSKQISEFLKAIHGHRYEKLYFVALFTGMRMGEILALSWDCINFDSGTIRIRRQLHQRAGGYEYGSLKNDKPRSICLAQEVLDVMKEQRAEQRRWKLLAGASWQNTENLVFTNEIGAHLCPNTVRNNLQRITDSIGIEGFRFHDLRHSYASASLSMGIDMKTLQQNMGHHTAAFTMEVYGHCTDEMQRSGASRMGRYIQEVSGLNAVETAVKG